MVINWNDMKKALYPIKDYEDLSRRWREAFAYTFVHKSFNFSMAEMENFAQLELGGDTRNRYAGWLESLLRTFRRLAEAGVRDVLDLVDQVDTREKFESFIDRTGMTAEEVISVLKYLVYWFLPAKKDLGELVKDDPIVKGDIAKLRASGIRSNLELLEKGRTKAARQELAELSGVPEVAVTGLVNRADFSRLPWTSRATISNFIGAGYGSLAQLAGADLEQVSADFYRYGASIGKNLKFGNEIDNSHRIAKIVPKVVEE